MKKKTSIHSKSIKNSPPKSVTEKVPAIKFNPEKIDLMRQTMITVLWRFDEIPETKFQSEIRKEIQNHFPDDFQHYFDKVKTDLEQKKLIENAPDKKIPCLRLAQKIEE